MFRIIMQKEIRHYFKSAGNWVFVFLLPILLILLMSSALKGYMKADFATFDQGILLYTYVEKTPENQIQMEEFGKRLAEATGVTLQEEKNYEEGVKKVNRSDALGLITLTSEKMSYYRSPYNETPGGKIVRSLFMETMNKSTQEQAGKIRIHSMNRPEVDSRSYATFTYLSFMIMFISLMTGHSISDERNYRTLERIKISKAGLAILLLNKVMLGLFIGALQIITVWAFSTWVLKVVWGHYTYLMVLVLLALSLMSSIFGVVIGMVSKTKSIADNTILMSIMLSGYIGGALSPVYLLENATFLSYVVKISPLYWSGRALNSLYTNMLDKNTLISIAVSLGLAVFFSLLYGLRAKKPA